MYFKEVITYEPVNRVELKASSVTHCFISLCGADIHYFFLSLVKIDTHTPYLLMALVTTGLEKAFLYDLFWPCC